MGLFDTSDKYKTSDSGFDLSNLELIDISKDLNTSLGLEKEIFGKFTIDEVRDMLVYSNMFTVLKERGYPDPILEIEVFSELDNRIFLKTKSNEILVHIRLKVSDFSLKKKNESFRMVYIDWLLTQNIRFKNIRDAKKLFRGQKYPGLNVMTELTAFLLLLTRKLGAKGVFNIPEYFHDAVLFHKNFKFLDPIKEGKFRSLLSIFKKNNLRFLSNSIHNKKIFNVTENQVYEWQFGEMLYTDDDYLNNIVFDENYYDLVEKTKKSIQFKRLL
ncbi:MAG: hypothetical protein L6Q54_10145 [Leptospiraceae bacterium]|nr:hypothetical protein [Leptospiraceae bacterium]MCK6381588.1 hypothetical protein [Leptospiraceae bacterium]NUM40636.1 hypothetical protein [Leptospiraceae bacterium]